MAADDDNGDGTSLFDVFSASPLKNNDEGSLDIYAGLDSAVADSTSKSCVPSRNCLDLYEEILTEEGTAKEATYNDLQVEYGKCQLQMKELMKKFKEIQTQNFSLKNENQSLKKNISALIKTARVEINRKDEEINNLYQRLSEFSHFRNNRKTARTSDAARPKDLRSRSPHLDDCSKTDHRVKSDVSKDVHHNTSLPNLEKEGKSHSEKKNSYLPSSVEKNCTNGIWSCSHYQIGEGNSNEDNRRGRKDIRQSQYGRGTERIRKDLSNSFGDGEPRNTETSPQLQGHPEKYGKGEPKAESKYSAFKSNTDSVYKSEHGSSSWEKETSRERSHMQVESQNDKKLERQNERLQNTIRKELKSQDREERKVDPKFKSVIKDQDHWRRSERTSLPHSTNEIKSHSSSKYLTEERRGREDCKRDRSVSSHSFQIGRCSSFSSSRTHKYMEFKEVDGTHHWENTPLKTERHRIEDKRKRERENKEENRHMRNDKKSPTEHLQKTNKETKKTADLKEQNGTKNDTDEVSSNEASEGMDNKEFALKTENCTKETKNKDLKLSFMEKLNLTLSPAKKQPICQDNQHKITETTKSNDIYGLESSVQAETVKCVPSVSEHTTEKTRSELLEPKGTLAAASELRSNSPESKIEETSLLVKSVENIMPCEVPICSPEMSVTTSVEKEQMEALFPSAAEMGETTDGATAADSVVTSVLQTDGSQNFGLGPDTGRHDSLNTQDTSETVEMKGSPSTKVAETSESLLQPSGEEAGVLPVNLSETVNTEFKPSLVDIPLMESESCHLEPCVSKEALPSSLQQTELKNHRMETGETNSVYHDDENSVLSIDLNQLRPIPEAISPLNSPVRPVAKVLRMESPPQVALYNKGVLPTNSSHSTSKSQSDLNKENQKPVCKFDKCTETDSCKNSSLYELEEGEIITDSEDSNLQTTLEKSANKPRSSATVQNTKTSPGCKKSTAHLNINHRRTYVKFHQTNSKWHKNPSESKRSSKTKRKDEIMSTSSLEKIVSIIAVPCSIGEIMHMLQMIKKHVKKNYMKFKVKFSLLQFHRIIESAILSFTSLIKHLDLSKISKSVTTLQKNLCDFIESKLKEVKKNGIVDRLFEQQLPDMKKKLWKFVDEQLDYLLVKLKKILVKFCDSVNFGSDNDEEKLAKSQKDKVQYSNRQKGNVDNKQMLRKKLPKSEYSVNCKSLSGSKKTEEKHQDQSNSSIIIVKHDSKRNFNTCFDNTKNSQSEEHSLELNCPKGSKPAENEGNTVEDSQMSQHASLKPERSFEILTEQQTSSLTFNLVSDAQMGEIFKSLLQGSDLLDSSVNCTEKSEWELKTPEKQLLESLKCESIPTCTTEELVSGVASPCPKMISDDNWSLSSEKGPSLPSGLSLPVHPDVLDENCMFEVSTNLSLNKDNVCSSEKSKPCISSILLEDLAVSLTVPSPLKSDGHLSFLKPEVLSSSTPEEVISAHFSEDALLEEEDASEQDIHLALESDNSSSKSSCSSWTSRSVAPGFQYHPNLPMHAVIMEKSNDHFIVKIRHAAPSNSPGLRQSKVADELLASLPRDGKETDDVAKKEYISCQSTDFKSVEELENCNKNVDTSKSANEEQNSMVQTQVPDIYEFLEDASDKINHNEEMPGDCFKLHQVWESKVPENIEELPSMEEIPHPVEDHLPNTLIDLTKDPVTETKNLGELIEVTVLNIDHLGCSRDNLDQNAQILNNSMQPETIDAFIDLTQDASSESKNEGNHPELVEDLGCQVICVDEDDCKEKVEMANRPLEYIVEEACIDLTTESSGSYEVKKEDLKSEPASNSDGSELSETSANVHKKRKYFSDLHHSQKKQRKEMDLSGTEKTKKLIQDSGENGEAHPKKASKKRAVNKDPSSLATSPGVKNSSPALTSSPTTSLSAKNVIKKKGEITILWTRNDDREILLECQKRKPSLKTFTHLAVKLNKNPNQVSERFQQLMKLFEKSKCR